MELMRNFWRSRCRTGAVPSSGTDQISAEVVGDNGLIDLPPFRCEESVVDSRRWPSRSTRSNMVSASSQETGPSIAPYPPAEFI